MVIALAITGPSSAAAVIYTYRGTISGVFDWDGTAFGGAIAPGDAFTAVFTREDKPGATQFYNGPPYGASYISGEGIDNPVSGKLTVGSLSFDIGQVKSPDFSQGMQYQDHISDHTYEGFKFQTYDSSDYDNGVIKGGNYHYLYVEAESRGSNWLKSSDYHDLGSLSVAKNPGFVWIGQYYFGELAYEISTGNVTVNRQGILDFSLTSLTVGVPEPTTWALMIGGFGIAGAMLRRRRGAPA